MKINHSVEKTDGSVVFQGVLEGPELQYVVETGLNQLIKSGAIPFLDRSSFNPASLQEVDVDDPTYQ